MHVRTKPETVGRILSLGLATTLAVAFTAMLPPAHAEPVEPPPVPGNLRVPAGHKPFLVGHAYGTQNYMCLPSGSAVAWTLVGPQANLFDDDHQQITTHYFSPNPDENGTLRATWQHSRDTSAVWGQAIDSSADPAFVEPGAIAWLLIRVVGAEEGPTGGKKLSAAYIQRLNTSGGVAPATGCESATDIGSRRFVPYTADYVFFRERNRPDTEE